MANEKMKNIAEVFGLKRQGPGTGRNNGHPNAIVFSNIQRADPAQRTLRVAFGEEVMKQARFMSGDMVTVDIDLEAELVLFRRVSRGEDVRAWTLCPNSAPRSKGGSKAMLGKTVTTSIRIPGTDALFAWFGVPNRRDVKIVNEYIISGNSIMMERP